MKYTPVIGLEVHVELKTLSKMFCGCANDWFGKAPNSKTCPVCLGLPGALPVPNKKAVEWCLQIGMALNCAIPLVSKFDRKNYFYPDLAKGYQISQYDQPFATNGSLKLRIKNQESRIKEKTIRIRRVHMEEDTGKLMHETVNGENVSLIDFNRSGVPLVEIVTDPDFESAEEVTEYLQKLQQIVRYLGVATADMEKGEMRLEPNISLREIQDNQSGIKNYELPNYKVEVKNINSFSFVEKAIAYEIERQAELLDKGETPKQETRGWDEDKKMTIPQRNKEEAADYRYFPEPDIPGFEWTEGFLDSLKQYLPELPDVKQKRFEKQYGLSSYNTELITRTKELADYFEEACRIAGEMSNDKYQISNIQVANTIVNKKVNIEEVLPAQLIAQIVKSTQISGISDEELKKVLKMIIEEHVNVVIDYKSGKTNAIMFLVGQAMKELKGREKADKMKAALEKMLQ